MKFSEKINPKDISLKMSDYESDDAPEAINFAASKELVLKEVKAAAEAVLNQKQKKKEARKQREEITQ